MSATSQGRFDGHLDVTRSRTIQGAVTDGATVRTGATLAVQGAAGGHFIIEPDAILTVQGALSGTFDNQGSVLVAGVVADGLPHEGLVGVAAGTVLAFGPPSVVRPDGSLERLATNNPDMKIDGGTGGYLAYNTADGTFHPMGSGAS